MKIPHPIPYQGSKRHIAKFILPFFPQEIDTLIEPFAGSAAISIAAACHGKTSRFHLNDLNRPLAVLWQEIITNPKSIAATYENLWNKQLGKERGFYDKIRDEFNQTHQPEYLLYLLARCVKASVRYNAKGEFNQSPDNRRLGRNPEQMTADIFAVSKIFQNKTKVTSKDYKDILTLASKHDLVYMDPPYQGVCSAGDPRYYSGIEFDEFMHALSCLTKHGIAYILSYDGRTGDKSYGQELPPELKLHQLEIQAGRSSQSTLLGRSEVTYESIYLSQGLIERLDDQALELMAGFTERQSAQLTLI